MPILRSADKDNTGVQIMMPCSNNFVMCGRMFSYGLVSVFMSSCGNATNEYKVTARNEVTCIVSFEFDTPEEFCCWGPATGRPCRILGSSTGPWFWL